MEARGVEIVTQSYLITLAAHFPGIAPAVELDLKSLFPMVPISEVQISK